MTNTTFASGAFVFTRARGLQPRDPGDLASLALRYGIPTTFIPTYPGDRTAMGRALAHASSGLYREGFLLRPIRRSSSEVTYGIVRESKSEDKLDHDHEATVSWFSEPDPSVVVGDHPIAQRVAAAYRDLRGKVVAEDWSAVISDYLEQHHAARVRGDGRVYWVPPGESLEAVRTLGTFLADVGIDLILAEIEATSRRVVTAVAQESLDEQLVHLEAEVEKFDGTQKPSTYVRRLEEYQRLRERAGLYRDALGLGVEKAETVLASLEQKVTSMLDIRQNTVVHRDGSVSATNAAKTDNERPRPATDTPATQKLPTDTIDSISDIPASNDDRDAIEMPRQARQGPTALHFAGATFTAAPSTDPAISLFVSDDEAAITTARLLESMGLAGRWQQAGTCGVNIRNSGPVGAAVSIRIRVPRGEVLSSMETALSGIGIALDPV